jgi:flagellar basal body-associated protein FliL
MDMDEQAEEKPKTKVKRLVVVLLLFFAITIIAGIVIPSIPIYRPESYCRRVESEAVEIKAALSDYFSNPAHNDINMKTEALADMEYIKNPTKYLCEYAART